MKPVANTQSPGIFFNSSFSVSIVALHLIRSPVNDSTSLLALYKFAFNYSSSFFNFANSAYFAAC